MRQAGDDEAEDTATLLLANAMGVNTAGLYARLTDPLSSTVTSNYEQALRRRSVGEPVAYITGWQWFGGLRLAVDRRVLVPRPETELLVEEASNFLQGRQSPRLLDIGTGSGAIPLAILSRLPLLRATGADVSSDALAVAISNRDRIGLPLDLVRCDLLAGFRGSFDVITANLPYIPTAEIAGLTRTVRDFEPMTALDGGPTGVGLIHRFMQKASDLVGRPGLILAEHAAGQGEALVIWATRKFPAATIVDIRDPAGLDRCLRVEFR